MKRKHHMIILLAVFHEILDGSLIVSVKPALDLQLNFFIKSFSWL